MESLLSGFILGTGPGDGLLANVIHRVAALFVISQPILARGDVSRRNFAPSICGSHLRKAYVQGQAFASTVYLLFQLYVNAYSRKDISKAKITVL